MEEQSDPRLISLDAEPGITPLSDDFDWPPATDKRGGTDSKFIELLGPLAAYRLFVHLGGSRTYVSRKSDDSVMLSAVIGKDGIERLNDAGLGGEYIKVPICREWRVLVLRRQGYTYAEIAARLVISQNKVWEILSHWGGLNEATDRGAVKKRSRARNAARSASEAPESRFAKFGEPASANEINALAVREEQGDKSGDLIEGAAPSDRVAKSGHSIGPENRSPGSSGQIGNLIGDTSDERPVPDLGPTAAEKFARWRDAKLGERGPSDQIPKNGNLIAFPSLSDR